VDGLPVFQLAFGLAPRSEVTRIVVYAHCQVSFQSSSDLFDQTEASVFSAEMFPGDVDRARQVHHQRMADNLCHRGGVATIPNLETTRAKVSEREVLTTMSSSSRVRDRLERCRAHALRYFLGPSPLGVDVRAAVEGWDQKLR
jgi:hypothetical protein